MNLILSIPPRVRVHRTRQITHVKDGTVQIIDLNLMELHQRQENGMTNNKVNPLAGKQHWLMASR